MATIVGDFLQSMKRECGDHHPDPVLALDWLQGRYAEALERAPFSFLVKESNFSTTKAISAGTVTLNLGSATVTESVSNANGWSSSIVGRYFRRRGDTAFYSIDAFGDLNPDTITLNRGYEGDTATLQTYDIWQRYYSLASDVRHVVSVFMGSGSIFQLQEVSQTDIDIGFPNRPSLGNPSYWSLAGRDSSDLPRMELYPIPDTTKSVYYRYIQTTPSLADQDATILPQVPLALLRSGWISDFWSWRGAFDAAPAGALLQSQKFEAEFQKRLQELIIRETLALSPKRVRFAPRFVRHRLQTKFSREANIELT